MIEFLSRESKKPGTPFHFELSSFPCDILTNILSDWHNWLGFVFKVLKQKVFEHRILTTSSSTPNLSRKSTSIPDSFSASLPNDPRSKENPTANVGLANLMPAKTSTWTGTPRASMDAVNLNTPFLCRFLSNWAGAMVKFQMPTRLREKPFSRVSLKWLILRLSLFMNTISGFFFLSSSLLLFLCCKGRRAKLTWLESITNFSWRKAYFSVRALPIAYISPNGEHFIEEEEEFYCRLVFFFQASLINRTHGNKQRRNVQNHQSLYICIEKTCNFAHKAFENRWSSVLKPTSMP